MKKLLAMFLAICMIMSVMTFVVSAEDEHPTESTKIRLESEIFGNGEFVANPEGGNMVMTIGAGKHSIGSPQFSWNGKATDDHEAITFDVREMEYMIVEMYVSHPEYLNGKTFEMELGSDGGPDGQENAYVDNFSQYAEGGELKAGWNTVKIPMEKWAAGSADLSAINDFRWFNRADQTGDIEIPEGTYVHWNIGSVKFVNETTNTVLEVPKNTKEAGGAWGSVSYTDFAGTRNYAMTVGQDVGGGAGFVMNAALEEAIDLSTYKYVDIYAYVEGAAEMRNIEFQIELTSSGTCDAKESNYTGYLNNVNNGWTTIRIPLSAFINKSADGGADFSAINFVRMYTQKGTIAETDVKFNVGYVQFSDSAATRYEEYVIPVGNEATLPENVTLVSTASDNKTDCMFADVDQEIVYKIGLEYIQPSFVYIVAPLGGDEAEVQVSTKNNADDYITVFGEENPIPGFGVQVINVSNYINNAKYAAGGYNLFFRVGDYDTADGAGGQIRYSGEFRVIVGYSAWEKDPDEIVVTDEMIKADEDEMLATEHSIPLFGCNTAIGGFTIDYEDYKGGSSSLVYKLGTWTEVDKTTGEEVEKKQVGQAGFSYKTIDFAGEETIDVSGMDTLEFWFYCSNREALAAAGFQDNQLELTSSGTCDKEETGWRMTDILAQCTQDGWNEIRLPISGNATDWTRLNFMRWYFINASNLPAEPVIIKIDNIRLTDYTKQQKELQKPAAEAMIAKINSELEGIPEWDAENADVVAQYAANSATWREKYEALSAELKALNTIAQDLVSEAGAKKTLSNVDKWCDKYDKHVEKLAKEEAEKQEQENQGTTGGDEQGTTGGDEQQGTTGGDEQQGTTGGDEQKTEEKKGCGSAISVGAGAMMLLAAAWVSMTARKKED